MVMPTENFLRLAQARDDLLLQRSAWADEHEFMIAQKLRDEAIAIIEDGTRDWAFESWRTKEHAGGRRYESDVIARAAYAASRMPQVSVLFARSDSCYAELVSDVWDAERDARKYTGSNPVVCHPPCRAWGRLRHLAKPRPDEKALALFAVEQIRRVGGVLEHPMGSTLWHEANLPLPGHGVDQWGGFSVLVEQGWWGHAAPKPTYLYICGVSRSALPPFPVQLRRAAGKTLELSPADRERTPPAFARYLVGVAAQCSAPAQCYSDLAAVTSAGGGNSELDAVTSGQGRSNTDLAAVTCSGRVKRAPGKRAAFAAFARLM